MDKITEFLNSKRYIPSDLVTIATAEELAKEILKMLQLEIGKDINEFAIPNIAILIEARVNSKLLELRVMWFCGGGLR